MNRINLHDITIRTTIQPGDLGYVIYMHGTMYSREHHFGLAFETYVASGMAEFFKAYEPTRNRVWVCTHQDAIIGFLALVSRGDTAQLRYFLLAPAYRGIGLGRKLMDQFMSALNELGYNSCYLLTTDSLPAAAHLYLAHGFRLTEEVESTGFGVPLKELRYEWNRP